MPADDYRDGIEGAGSAWKEEVDTDEAENNYEGGATNDAADDYQSNASASSDAYAEGLADYLGISANDVGTASSYANGVSEAGAAWREGVSRSGGKWRRGVSRASASDYEEAAAAAADDWFQNFSEGVQEG